MIFNQLLAILKPKQRDGIAKTGWLKPIKEERALNGGGVMHLRVVFRWHP